MTKQNDKVFQVFNDSGDQFEQLAHQQSMSSFPILSEYRAFSFQNTQTGYLFGSYCLPKKYNQDCLQTLLYLFPPISYLEEYNKYMLRIANMSPYNIYKKTINSVIGLMSRKDPVTDEEMFNESDELFFSNVDGKKNDYKSFINNSLIPSSFSGEGGILVSYSDNKPIFRVYDSIHISKCNRRYKMIENEEFLERIILVEKYKYENGEFEDESCDKATILRLIKKTSVEDFINGGEPEYPDENDTQETIASCWEIVYSDEKVNDDMSERGVYTNSAGEYFNTIPFFMYKADKKGGVPFFDACRTNLKLATMQSSFENGLRIASFPILIHKNSDNGGLPEETITGADGKVERKVDLKPETIVTLDTESEMMFLEYEGKSFEVNMQNLYKLANEVMVMVLANLNGENKQMTKAESDTIQTNNTSTVVTMVKSMQKAVNTAIIAADFFRGIKREAGKKIKITMNTDFVKEASDSNLLREFRQSVLDGFLSAGTAYKELQKKELLSENVTVEGEREKMDNETGFRMTEDV